MKHCWLQDFRSRLVKLMVAANDDPQTPAYQEIEQLVEAQVLPSLPSGLHDSKGLV